MKRFLVSVCVLLLVCSVFASSFSADNFTSAEFSAEKSGIRFFSTFTVGAQRSYLANAFTTEYDSAHGRYLQVTNTVKYSCYDVTVAFALYNSTSQAVSIDRLVVSTGYSSDVRGFGTFSAGDGYSVNFYATSGFGITTPYRSIVIPAGGWVNASVNFELVSNFERNDANLNSSLVTAFSFNTAAMNLTFGDFVSQQPATDGNQDKINQSIQDQTQQQQEQYDDFTSSGDGSIVDSSSSQIGEKVGIFTAVDTVLTGVWGVFSSPPGDATLVFPSYSLDVGGQSYKLWENYSFDFAVLDTWGLGVLKTAINFITVFIVYGALLHYLQKLYDRIFGGGSG